MDIKDELDNVNKRLKYARMGITIEARGNMLNLRATLPPKPGSDKTQPHQQRIALKVHANPTGLSYAEKEAKRIGILLNSKEFDWGKPLRPTKPVKVVADWIADLENDYFNRRARNSKSETTWNTNYLEVFRKLPQDKEITPDVLDAAILSTQPATRIRQKLCLALDVLAKFVGLTYDAKAYASGYTSKRLTPRELPDDKTIIKYYSLLPDPAWRWVYGAIATFGLRPHEAFQLSTSALTGGSHTVEVLDGKTGFRKVWAFYPEWVEIFNLRTPILPKVTGHNNRDLGQRVAQYFRRQEIPFKPYDLRHCWAVRTMELGLDITLAAQQMGHSRRVHSDIYHYWISDRHHQKAYEEIMQQRSR